MIKIVSFEEVDDRRLTLEQKQAVCRFTEEALCNVGKYAEGITRLEISCKTLNGWNTVRIADNGVGTKHSSTSKGGYGTRQAANLARQLGGRFRRTPNSPQGIICELSYPVSRSWFQSLWKRK
ncbi:MAG: sensor histidine kinase [Leptolyngbyaceae cyanobacterium SM1_3_5]|nr:sensor histidine kinase [Leptolyngbyaceae cyanobacterium SM1_3_5]